MAKGIRANTVKESEERFQEYVMTAATKFQICGLVLLALALIAAVTIGWFAPFALAVAGVGALALSPLAAKLIDAREV